MTSIKEALKIIQRTIKGDQIEAAVVDVGTMMPLGKVVSDALAQLDSADAVAWQYRDDRWDDDRWHVCAERPRDTKGRRIRALYTGLLPDASPGNGAVTSSVVAKIEEARDLFWDIKGDFSDPRAECRRGADLLEEVLAALHSTSAAGETREPAWQANLREAWAALAMIRETVETLGPVGAIQASEHLSGPTFMHEAEAIVQGIQLMALTAGETTSSDGGVEGHAEGPQGHSCSREPEAGNTASSGQMTPAGIKPGPSEAIPAASGGKHNGHHLR